MVHLEEIKEEAKKILEKKKVKYIIGFARGTSSATSIPVFIKRPEEVERLIWDPTCIHNLARFLVDEKRRNARQKNPDIRPVGIIVKGCDSRAVNVLLQEKFLRREDLYIMGVSCEAMGVIDEKKLAATLNNKRVKKIEFGEKKSLFVTTEDEKREVPAPELLAQRCLECSFNFPLIYDVLFGEKVAPNHDTSFQNHDNSLRSLERIEGLSTEERWAFWSPRFDRCIRCYACRSVCPMCYCDECVVDTINFAVTQDTTAQEKAQKIKWLERSSVLSENLFYHLVRAIHLAGRCIDCGECERVCPVDIPLRLLNRKLESIALEQFDYRAGLDAEQPPFVSSFKDEDPQDFIR